MPHRGAPAVLPPPGEGLRILDIGTGSGAIGVVLARELPAARVGATDISAAALSVARRNALVHGVADRVDFFQGDLLTAVSGNFDIICSNPPYIPDVQYGLLPAGIRDFEPRGALIAGPDGMDFHRRIIREGAHRLKAGGRIFLEIGEGQRDRVEALFREEGGYRDIDCRKDYGDGPCRVGAEGYRDRAPIVFSENNRGSVPNYPARFERWTRS